ncbi:MAG TPA: hypothetical protein VEA15_07495 [Caulobacteraceae bacterium]|nr:hypothetical protein [Caulobacteraceae bacterium]
MRLGLALLMALAATPAVADDCRLLMAGDRVEGEFRWVESRHPNGEAIRAPFIVTGARVCVPGESLVDGTIFNAEGHWLQLGLADDSVAESLVPGELYSLTAEYDVPMTAWHIGDIMAFEAQVLPIESAP